MEMRRLGHSGFFVPAISFGTGTFGGHGEFFEAWDSTQEDEATRLVDICPDAGLNMPDAGVNMFDSADIYSAGRADEVLRAAIRGRRDKVPISTKATFRAGMGPTRWAPRTST